MAEGFVGILAFFEQIGVYRVVLPFLLVFTIVFAILEKTKVFGMETIGEKKYTRKNVNAMVAFSISFMVIASAQLVEIITAVSSWMVILLMLSISFLILVGSFWQEGEGVFLEGPWRNTFMAIMFIGIIAIFLEAIKRPDGEPWLEFLFRYIVQNFSSTAVASIILVVIVVIFMWWIAYYEPKHAKAAKQEE
jgi:hypothetical protein